MKKDAKTVKTPTMVRPNTKSAKNNKSMTIKIVVAAVLLVAVLASVIVIAIACSNTEPYGDVNFSKHLTLPTYFGRNLSAKDVNEAFEEDKQALIDAYTKYSDPITTGTIEEGHNVTISISAYKYDETKTGNRGDAISDISIDKYTILNIHKVDTSKDAEKEDDKTEYFPEMQNMLLGTKFDFTPGTSYNNVRTLVYTYPTDYTVKTLQGVKVIHLVYISSVTTTIAPELNDQFFVDHKDDLGYESYNEYKDYMIYQIKLNLLWNKIVEETKVTSYPEDYVNAYYDEYDYNVKAYMQEKNISTVTALYSALGVTESEFYAQRKEYAEGTVKEEMILYYIVEKENIEVSDTEYDTILAQIAEDAGYSSAKAYLDAYGEALTDRTVLWEKVKKLILDSAIDVE